MAVLGWLFGRLGPTSFQSRDDMYGYAVDPRRPNEAALGVNNHARNPMATDFEIHHLSGLDFYAIESPLEFVVDADLALALWEQRFWFGLCV